MVIKYSFNYECETFKSMKKAKEGGMKFYGLAVNLYNPRSMGIMEAEIKYSNEL